MSLKLFKPAMGIIALALMFAPAPVEAAGRQLDIVLEVARQNDAVVWRPAAVLVPGATEAQRLEATVKNAGVLTDVRATDTITFHLINTSSRPHTFRVQLTNNAAAAVVPPHPAPVGVTVEEGGVVVGVGRVVEVTSDPLTANTDYRSFCTLHSPNHAGPTFSTIHP